MTYDFAIALIRKHRNGSISFLQEQGCTYREAADYIERAEREGLISKPNAQGRRKIKPSVVDLMRAG